MNCRGCGIILNRHKTAITCFDCPAELGEAYSMSTSSAIGICTFGEYETKEAAAKAWNRREK